jgi:hypothetical protein
MAAVILQWSPPTFWAASPHEFWAAIEFKQEMIAAERLANGG